MTTNCDSVWTASSALSLWQLGEIHRHAAGLVAREQLGHGAASRFILEIDVGELALCHRAR